MLIAHHVNCPECNSEEYVTLDGKTNDLIDCTGCGKLFGVALEIQVKKFRALGFESPITMTQLKERYKEKS
jgi:transcription elongation factor Elf1